MSLRHIRLIAFALAWILAAYVIVPQGTIIPSPAHPPAGGQATGSTSSSLHATTHPAGFYHVVHVVDGDTIDVLKDDAKIRVRLIGINTPETVDPRKPVQCFGIEASNEMKRIVGGQPVRLESDPSQDTFDKYDRTLAYIFLPDGTNVNEHMIAEGFAHEYTYRLPYTYQKEFKAAEAAARTAGKGLWKTSGCNGRP